MILDPKRYARATLADPSHKLPWKGRLFGVGADEPGVETVDLWDAFVLFLLSDGSLKLAPAAGEPSVPADA